MDSLDSMSMTVSEAKEQIKYRWHSPFFGFSPFDFLKEFYSQLPPGEFESPFPP